MTQAPTNIVKKDQVRLAGTRMLDRDSQGAALPGGHDPQPRIVENKDGLVVIEVTCECGKKIYLHCDCRGS